MSSKENYDVKLETLMSIPQDQVMQPGSIPVDVYIQEALDLSKWCQPDMAALTAKGLDPTLVEDLPVRCGALREAQSIWMKLWDAKQAGQAQWEAEGPLAIQLRELLAQEFRFAFRNDPSLLKRVAAIDGSSSQAAIIQDLNDLSVLGLAQPELLAATQFDTTLLSRAAQIAADIGLILATAKQEVIFGNAAKDVRDRGYTHLKAAVDEIYTYGRFVFRKNAKRLAGYRSRYLRLKQMARAALAVEKAKAA